MQGMLLMRITLKSMNRRGYQEEANIPIKKMDLLDLYYLSLRPPYYELRF